MSIEAMKQAIEALEKCYDVDSYPASGTTLQDKAITTLRQAIAEAEQTTPPQRKPLTDEQTQPETDKVICPKCIHQFRAIPEDVQKLLLDAGFEPPFVSPPPQRKPLTDDAALSVARAAAWDAAWDATWGAEGVNGNAAVTIPISVARAVAWKAAWKAERQAQEATCKPLTNDEIDILLLAHNLMDQWPTQKQIHAFTRAIEAKLKENT